jgi:hypothetical protein
MNVKDGLLQGETRGMRRGKDVIRVIIELDMVYDNSVMKPTKNCQIKGNGEKY